MFSVLLFGTPPPTWCIFVELAVCGLLVALIGARLTHMADAISDLLNLGKAWVGVLLLASVTSLPEVVTSSTAVLIGQPDLAFGNIFGSCMFNVAIIVILDGILRRGSVLGEVTNASHGLSASLGIILIAVGVLSMNVMGRLLDRHPADSLTPRLVELVLCAAIAVTYLVCMRMTFRFERQQAAGQLKLPAVEGQTSSTIYAQFGVLSAVLVLLTIWLARTGDVLQDHPIEVLGGRTLGATFVGAFFLAVATSLPEIVTSATAVRMGHLDLALGNIFGSNMFNIFVIPFLKCVSLVHGDAVLMGGPHFSMQLHTMAALLAILVTAVASGSLIYRTKRRLFHFGFDSAIIGIIYVIGFVVLLN